MYSSLVDAVRQALTALLQGRAAAVWATLLVYALFAALRAVGQLVVNRKVVERAEAEIRNWEERRRKAIEARDMKLYERVLREKSRVDNLKRELEKERLKASLATLAVWLLCFKVLWDAAGNLPAIDAPLPWGYARITFAAWFILNSFWSGALLDKAALALRPLRSRT